MHHNPQTAFILWLFFSVMLGILWILAQYARSLWRKTKTMHMRLAWMRETGSLSKNSEIEENENQKEASQDGKDQAKL